MELDVTHMVDDSDHMPLLSGSRAELGDNASKITWNNSITYGTDHPLLATDEAREAARDHFADYGAWSREEIDAWSEEELQAITCQEAASAIREMEHADSYEDFMEGVEAGRYSGRLYRGNDGRWYLYLGS